MFRTWSFRSDRDNCWGWKYRINCFSEWFRWKWIDLRQKCITVVAASAALECDVGLWPQPLPSKLQPQLIQSQSFRLGRQHKDADFSASRRSYKTQQCFFNRQMFRLTHPLTKEVFERSWLCYSPATGKAFFSSAYSLPKMNSSVVFMTGKMPCVGWRCLRSLSLIVLQRLRSRSVTLFTNASTNIKK